jgi:hypothetical protein
MFSPRASRVSSTAATTLPVRPRPALEPSRAAACLLFSSVAPSKDGGDLSASARD